MNPNKKLSTQHTIILETASQGHLERLKGLYRDSSPDVNWQDDDGFTALAIAAQYGQAAIVEYLLQRKADPNLATNTGATPLYLASFEKREKVVRVLLRNGVVDVNKATEEGLTPLHGACVSGAKGIVEQLLNNPKVDVMKTDNNGATPLFAACEVGRANIVTRLLKHPQIEPSRPTKFDATALWIAAQNGDLTIVKLLLLSGKELNTTMKCTFDGCNATAANRARWAQYQPKWKGVPNDDPARRRNHCASIAKLIDDFEEDPIAVRERLRQPGAALSPSSLCHNVFNSSRSPF